VQILTKSDTIVRAPCRGGVEPVLDRRDQCTDTQGQD
jgi:hypothetical protein